MILLGGASIAATALSAVGRATDSWGLLETVGCVVAAVALNMGVCLAAFRVTTARGPLSCKSFRPGPKDEGGEGGMSTRETTPDVAEPDQEPTA